MASKRRIRRASCVGKMQHKTPDAAAAHARAQGRKSGDRLHHYKCKRCPFWHVGHPMTRVKRTRRSQFA